MGFFGIIHVLPAGTPGRHAKLFSGAAALDFGDNIVYNDIISNQGGDFSPPEVYRDGNTLHLGFPKRLSPFAVIK
ncbi:hypothetical protein [Celeribacter indicus]|uniref:hypothetical protein n=1 Tax=Celeribacter indicus TaxID=1208324 RepID=UPI00158785DF|nr:hypothetical protein [Celeribacter indicus]